jgi:hypothetical protein
MEFLGFFFGVLLAILVAAFLILGTLAVIGLVLYRRFRSDSRSRGESDPDLRAYARTAGTVWSWLQRR